MRVPHLYHFVFVYNNIIYSISFLKTTLFRFSDYKSLHFVAVNSPNNFGSRPEIDVWSNHEVSLGVYSGGNEDYMAAFESDEYKQANHGTVKLQFHHLLSQIKFGISNMSNNLEIMDIKQIGLKGVYQ